MKLKLLLSGGIAIAAIIGGIAWWPSWPYDMPEPAQTDPMAVRFKDLDRDKDRPRYVDEGVFKPFLRHIVLDLVADGIPVHIDRTVVCRHTYVEGVGPHYVADFRQRTMSVRLPNKAAVLAMAPPCWVQAAETSAPLRLPEDWRPMVIYLHPDQNQMDIYLHPAGYEAPASHLRWGGISVDQPEKATLTPPDEFWWARGQSKFDLFYKIPAGFPGGDGLEDVSDRINPCPAKDESPVYDAKAGRYATQSTPNSAMRLTEGSYWLGDNANINTFKTWVPMVCYYGEDGISRCGEPDFSKSGIFIHERGILTNGHIMKGLEYPKSLIVPKKGKIGGTFVNFKNRCYKIGGFMNPTTLSPMRFK